MIDRYSWLDKLAGEAAPRLLGCILRRTIGDQAIDCRIVEVEAYDQTDAASHSYKGRTPRTDVMFGPSGHLYVYFTYGMHYCANVVVGEVGYGSAVLIRAVEPLNGLEIIRDNRGDKPDHQLTNGPAKFCQALAIDKSFNGHDLSQTPLELLIKPAVAKSQIVQTTRIGISRAKDQPWRWYIKGNSYVSKT
ncbi:MAG TPA: DNA-3-methyladenine glycosylase [Candidatus Saccharimonadales bacterium]|nr:DNA-3-methyladenine glycosylase [Candidatus Saccharimonadales bacterium]